MRVRKSQCPGEGEGPSQHGGLTINLESRAPVRMLWETCLQKVEAIEHLMCLCGKDGQFEVELGMNS